MTEQTENKNWYDLRDDLNKHIFFKTESDVGSVKLFFDDGSSINIRNGYGDGVSRVGVIEDETEFNFLDYKKENILKGGAPVLILDYFAKITVKNFAFIQSYDCNNDYFRSEFKLEAGSYSVYNGDTFVIFVKCNI